MSTAPSASPGSSRGAGSDRNAPAPLPWHRGSCGREDSLGKRQGTENPSSSLGQGRRVAVTEKAIAR